VPRPKLPKLTSPDERRKLVDIEDKRRFGPALVANGIAYDDDGWAEAARAGLAPAHYDRAAASRGGRPRPVHRSAARARTR
jgi:hypothetical protein